MTAIRDIMSPCSVVIRPDFRLTQAAKLLIGHHIDGAPVVDYDGSLVGFVSEFDLLDIVFDLSARDARVSEIMASDPPTISGSSPIVRLAQIFALFPCRRLPVVEDGKLLGIVSRRDLLKHGLCTNLAVAEPIADPLLNLATVN